MIITTIGHGNTGASAVLDFLRGYDDINIVDGMEFQIIQMTDGLLDLKYHLTQNCQRISSNAAIARFKRLIKNSSFARNIRKRIGHELDSLTHEYLQKIISVAWRGRSNMDPADVSVYSSNAILRKMQRYIGAAQRKLKWQCTVPPLRERYFCMLSEQQFNEITKEFIKKLLQSMKLDLEQKVTLDMLFSATKPTRGMEFFDDCKVIRVNRDPRDIFAGANGRYFNDSFMPLDRCENYAKYYRTLMEFSEDDERILDIQYEDLIYRYYETTDKIMKFLGLSERPKNEFKFFNPDVSVKYTNRYANRCTESDIALISELLSDYLYDFQAYSKVSEQKEKYEQLKL